MGLRWTMRPAQIHDKVHELVLNNAEDAQALQSDAVPRIVGCSHGRRQRSPYMMPGHEKAATTCGVAYSERAGIQASEGGGWVSKVFGTLFVITRPSSV
jgi:hypothetical protein